MGISAVQQRNTKSKAWVGIRRILTTEHSITSDQSGEASVLKIAITPVAAGALIRVRADIFAGLNVRTPDPRVLVFIKKKVGNGNYRDLNTAVVSHTLIGDTRNLETNYNDWFPDGVYGDFLIAASSDELHTFLVTVSKWQGSSIQLQQQIYINRPRSQNIGIGKVESFLEVTQYQDFSGDNPIRIQQINNADTA